MDDPRQEIILQMLDEHGSRSYEQLSQSLGVSTMTVRRAVDQLVRQGAAIKTVGGVQRASAPNYLCESTFQVRLFENRPAKRVIAQQVVQLLRPSQTIYLDGSTTCLEVARLLGRRAAPGDGQIEITALTNSALTCIDLGRSPGVRVIGIGGQYDPASLSFVGPTAESFAESFFVDLAIISTKGFVPEEGTFESAEPVFRIKQIIARKCARLVLLVDHTKLGKRALSRVLQTSQIETVITDAGASDKQIEEMRKHVRNVLVAPLPKLEPSASAGA
jgi:DeoR/GlpR family transcriptional regulator of sugar metabolism